MKSGKKQTVCAERQRQYARPLPKALHRRRKPYTAAESLTPLYERKSYKKGKRVYASLMHIKYSLGTDLVRKKSPPDSGLFVFQGE